MGRFVLRSSASAAAWEDVTTTFSGMPAELGGTDGRKVRLQITSGSSDWGTVTGTGASVTRIAGGAFDGTDALRLVPPTVGDQYSCILRFLDLSNGGSKSAYQANMGFCLQYGSRYWDLGHQDKLTGFVASQTVGGTENPSASRAAIFDAFKNIGGSDFRRVYSITATTVPCYAQPPDIDIGATDANKPLIIGSTSNHANDPPLVSTEVLYLEQEVDYSRTHGNADGRNRLDIWARDGYLGYLEIPLSWRETGPDPDGDPWDFTYQYARVIEYIGGYWNNTGTADANNYLQVSHPIVALNRGKDQRIGPPPGFLL